MRNFYHYMRTELARGFLSWRLPVTVVLIAAAFACSRLEDLQYGEGLLTIISLIPSQNGIGGALVWMLAAFPYAASMCEELEHRYHIQKLLRGDVASYLSAKLCAVFLSGLLSVLLGFLLFVLAASLRCPMISEYSTYLSDGAYIRLAEQGWYLPYFLLVGLQLGCLAGTLNVIAFAISIWIPNQMLVYAMPTAFLFIEDMVVIRLVDYSVSATLTLNSVANLSISTQYYGNTWYLGYIQMAIALAVASVAAFTLFRRRLEHE